ncbi:hypothetical protein ABQD65_13680, partial [Vagococcus fluvialis]
SLIPSFDFDFNISGHIGAVVNTFGYIDSFVSINTVVFCISAILFVDNFSFVLKIINFIWSKIPFIN